MKTIGFIILGYAILCFAADPKPNELSDSTGLSLPLRLILFLPNALLGCKDFRIIIVPIQTAYLIACAGHVIFTHLIPRLASAAPYFVIAAAAAGVLLGIVLHVINKRKGLKRRPYWNDRKGGGKRF